jgi:hypothetical protein
MDRRPGFLAVIALVWIAVGVLELVVVTRFSFHVAAGIVFIGVGLLFARGALVGFLRSRGISVAAPTSRRSPKAR